MKDGLRFVDSDMHIMEPPDLFERYLDPKFKHRVSVPVGSDGRGARSVARDSRPPLVRDDRRPEFWSDEGGSAPRHLAAEREGATDAPRDAQEAVRADPGEMIGRESQVVGDLQRVASFSAMRLAETVNPAMTQMKVRSEKS